MDALVAQFRRPHGALGRVAGWVMARRASNRERNAWTVDLLGVESGHAVLEVGCGPGLALATCAARGAQVVGLDHSAVMLGQSRTRLAAAGLADRATLVEGNWEALAQLRGPFDRVLSVNLIQFLPDSTAYYRALREVLAPGARVATTYLPRLGNTARSTTEGRVEVIAAAMSTAGFAPPEVHWRGFAGVDAACVIGTTRAVGRGTSDTALGRCRSGC